MAKKLLAFPWYGGKYSHINWLCPLLPQTNIFVEPFGGSASILINRQPSNIEVYNDLDSEAVNFFTVLRDNHDDIADSLLLTPCSREGYLESTYIHGNELERSRRFYIRSRQTRMGLSQLGQVRLWGSKTSMSRCDMSALNAQWTRSIPNLSAISKRIRDVTILNQDALDIMKDYDSPDTLFYLDPPYLHETRSDTKCYGNEMSMGEHEEFGRIVNTLKGKVAISGYHHDSYDVMFPFPKWNKHIAKEKTAFSSLDKRQEVLWTNYDVITGDRL